MRRARTLAPLFAAASLFAGSFGLFRPGFVEYDSVAQYGQVLAGRYDDWHPPIMARLWALTATLEPGAGPMLAIQMAGYWAGLCLLAAALARAGRPFAGAATLLIGLWPPLLGWQAVVLKDAQMLGAMLLGLGIVAPRRIEGRPVGWRWTLAAVPFAYAALVRANAIFAVAPLVAMLASARPGRRALIGGTLLAGTLALSPVVNHRLLGAAASGVERTQPVYDLAGIAVRSPSAVAPFTLAQAQALRAGGCVKPFFWDPLGEPSRCGGITGRLRAGSTGALYAALASAALRHPLAYAAHRAAHLNSTGRWLVPDRWPDAAPPQGSEPNDLGLGEPDAAATAWQRLAEPLSRSPLCWPITWIALALTGLAAFRRADGGAAAVARALFVSALALEASFAVVSIASDLRYHLWPMTAAALGWMLAFDRARWGRGAIAGCAATGLIVAAGFAARLTLPPPPQSYEGMLG